MELHKITEREVLDAHVFNLHHECMKLICERVRQCSKDYNIPLGCFDISALTFQLFKIWIDKRAYWKTRRDNEQKKLDTK